MPERYPKSETEIAPSVYAAIVAQPSIDGMTWVWSEKSFSATGFTTNDKGFLKLWRGEEIIATFAPEMWMRITKVKP